MAYQALYRVWRPQRFDEMVGQETITQTIKNALIQQKTSHAYLFTGPRGTGKTSAAKIFAKALNCHHVVDGEPCNECEICLGINSGQLGDVIEIDAASNNGVEEIRDIRDKAKYAPTQADYKVYIIDEVHMLSTGAFNALLKTLEEPPKNVVFILATTEPHKIPLTIISRTQRFDFKRIGTQAIAGRMKLILDAEAIRYEEAALEIIAKSAEGGMRDALSILDQVISYGDDAVTLENALKVTGSLTYELLLHYFQQIADHDTEAALQTMAEMLSEGKDAQRIVEDFVLFARDLLLFQQAPKLENLSAAHIDQADFKALSECLQPETLYDVIDILNDTQNGMRLTNHPGIYLEVMTVKLTQIKRKLLIDQDESAQSQISSTDEELTTQITKLEKQVAQLTQQMQSLQATGGEVVATATTPKASSTGKNHQPSFHVNLTEIYGVLAHATKNELLQLKDVWEDLLQVLTVQQKAMLKASIPVAASKEAFIISFDFEILCQKATNDAALQEAVADNLAKFIQHPGKMICVPSEQWPKIRQDFLANHKDELQANEDQEVEITQEVQEDLSVVTEAQKLFGEDFVEIDDD